MVLVDLLRLCVLFIKALSHEMNQPRYYLEDLPAKGLVMLAPYPSNFNLVEKYVAYEDFKYSKRSI